MTCTNSTPGLFTTYIGVDSEHYKELLLSCETWRLFRPEIWQNPLVAICDGNFDLSFMRHPDLSVVAPLSGEFESQRHKMLSSLAIIPSGCKTKWFLKLDTDSVATCRQKWFEPEWFSSQMSIVASPWGYTKPASMLDDLDWWACRLKLLGNQPPRVYSRQRGVTVAKSRRFISHVQFASTAFAWEVAHLCGERLPVPSQDTVYWYLAERLGRRYLLARMDKFGWIHCGGSIAKLEAACRHFLNT